MNKKAFAASVLGVLASSALAIDVEPEITNLQVSQNDNRMVTITYTLTQDAYLSLDLLTNGVSIGRDVVRTVFNPASPASGYPFDGSLTAAGTHVLMWKPTRDWPNHVFTNGEFAVELKAWSLDNPPDYMVVDLQSPYARRFYPTAEDIPGGLKTADPTDATAVGALKNDPYRTEKLVMKKIAAAGNTWLMGSPASESSFRDPSEVQHYVTLTNDYYISIYPLTRYQRIRGTGVGFEWEVTPAAGISYNSFRGSATTGDAVWPDNGHAVGAGSELETLRTRTGLMFDFPTEAQWEYACRAGSSGGIWGTPWGDYGWFIDNASSTYKVVGLKKPNGWGLYDMNGLVSEWVLDQWGTPSTEAATEPAGPSDNRSVRVTKGGSAWYDYTVKGRSAARIGYAPNKGADENYGGGFGVRLCCPAKMPR